MFRRGLRQITRYAQDCSAIFFFEALHAQNPLNMAGVDRMSSPLLEVKNDHQKWYTLCVYRVGNRFPTGDSLFLSPVKDGNCDASLPL